MILRFPSIDVLRLALTSGVVTPKVQCAPAKVADEDSGAILVEASSPIGRGMMSELKKLGVERKRKVQADFRPVLSWHQALPLTKSPDLSLVDHQTQVLFEIEGEHQLPSIVAEILRLGNDRQSFRHVTDNGVVKTLLRVTAPPYYTMLRATDRTLAGDRRSDVAAYVEQSPRVWAEVGYRHPLGDRLEPPAGKWLLISRDNQWRFLKEQAFRDIYEILEFSLPCAAEAIVAREQIDRIEVPLRLNRASTPDVAELWVLTHDALSQLEKLIRRSDDQLISRLAFAVAASDPSASDPSTGAAAGPTVILRARPSTQLPPVLVLDGLACRSYLKIPNLFLPVGRRLHPPLRRDAVVKLLASQADQIRWLMPDNEAGFTPQSIPDNVFRPLSDWVDYVMDHESKPLEAWIASHRFDFEHFICHEDLDKKRPGPAKQQRLNETPPGTAAPETSQSPEVHATKRKLRKVAQDEQTELDFNQSTLKTPEQAQLQLRLRQLEDQFRQSDEPLDSPFRAAMWSEMALVNTALGHQHDSTICWVNSLWDPRNVDDDALSQWLRCEQQGLKVGELTLDALDGLLSNRGARGFEQSLVAAYVVWAANCDETPSVVVNRRTELTQFLQRQENDLPIRAAWLAWCGMYRMSGNDVLLLARARDRLLERLFAHGLTPEFDMSAFMRTGAVGDGDRFRILRDHLLRLRELVHRWITEPPVANDPRTKSYADLVFAYGLARLGETRQSGELLEAISTQLDRKDPIHHWVYQAFSTRVKQALAGQATQGHVSDELLTKLETMERMNRYKLDRLRQHSRILEPHVRIDPYRNWHQRYADELSRELAMLQNVVDRDELSQRITRLIDAHPSAAERVRILPSVLQLAPRIGDKFAGELLQHVPGVIEQCGHAMEKALVLQRALHLAAHYGRTELVKRFVIALNDSLPSIVCEYLALEGQLSAANKEKADTIELLLTQSFRGLRKLGMREEIGQLYARAAELVEQAAKKSLAKSRETATSMASRSQRLLLCVAGGWYYFGQQDQARSIVDKVQTALKNGELSGIEQKSLTCAYVDAVSQAPADEALERMRRVFQVDEDGTREFPRISDSMTTSSHFSLSQLDVVEAAVLSMISDDFSLSADARRWLDEDEFLVRSRIHRDMRQASAE